MADPIAIYGAVIGTAAGIGALWNVYQGAVRDRPRLTLSVGREFYSTDSGDEVVDESFALVSYDPREWEGIAATYPIYMRKAHVHVCNVGPRPITVIAAGFQFEDGYRIAVKPGTTGDLSEGQPLSFRASEEGLAQMLRKRSEPPRWVYAMNSAHRIRRRRLHANVQAWLDQLRKIDVKPP